MKKILRFSAEWCQPCKMLAKNIDAAGITLPIEYIDVDEQGDLAAQYKIRGVPTLVLVEGGQEVKRVSGVKTVDELRAWAQ
jgi:thioredoxin-like negative regulator of GroEL